AHKVNAAAVEQALRSYVQERQKLPPTPNAIELHLFRLDLDPRSPYDPAEPIVIVFGNRPKVRPGAVMVEFGRSDYVIRVAARTGRALIEKDKEYTLRGDLASLAPQLATAYTTKPGDTSVGVVPWPKDVPWMSPLMAPPSGGPTSGQSSLPQTSGSTSVSAPATGKQNVSSPASGKSGPVRLTTGKAGAAQPVPARPTPKQSLAGKATAAPPPVAQLNQPQQVAAGALPAQRASGPVRRSRDGAPRRQTGAESRRPDTAATPAAEPPAGFVHPDYDLKRVANNEITQRNREFDKLRLRGIALVYEHRSTEALACFREALQIRPGDPAVMAWLERLEVAVTQTIVNERERRGENVDAALRARELMIRQKMRDLGNWDGKPTAPREQG
ncbi:MAG: hypothetical protein VKP62_16465, partial [Candidatus Sericytochromatia bacterium]|nr:hypothetical protein [Candidatus Sericytochromatia bacterium]